VLADDACPECGTPMKEKKGKLKLPVNGEEIPVPEATISRWEAGRNVQGAAMDMLLRE
jgi:uncharacterized Zn finger protein (UPF0148 family)